MSIDISTGKSNSSKGLYETKTLLCKNKCGYYGNSIQYDGYCSICYRKLKNQKLNSSASRSSFSLASNNSSNLLFDDSSSLLASSQSFNNQLSLDDSSKMQQNQIWNEHTNLSKFSSKKETRRTGTFKLFRRQPSSSVSNQLSSSLNTHQNNYLPLQSASSSLTLVETVSKVADKAVNLVDQSLQNGILNNITNNSSFLSSIDSSNSESSILEFYNCLNKLTSTTSNSLFLNNISTTGNASSNLITNSNNMNSTNMVLIDFEEKFRINFPQLYQDLIKQMKQFVEKFLEAFKRKDQSVTNNNKQFEVVQEFYKKIYKYIQTSASIKLYLEKLNHVFVASLNNGIYSENGDSIQLNQDSSFSFDSNNLTQQQLKNSDDADKLYESVMIMVEYYINNNLYDFVFPSIMSEFEEQDMNLQKRIRDFYWITNEMIGTCIDENSIFYRDSYEEALNYIVEMDSKRTAYEKMLCITECSKNIYKAINISANVMRNINEVVSPIITPTNEEYIKCQDDEIVLTDFDIVKKNNNSNKNNSTKSSTVKSFASADDYLPAFIYIVLKTNPTMLYSNINFITRFAFEKRILQGEHAYHFCSLNAIISHIENLNAEHLNMTQEQFENYCNGLIDINSSNNVLKIIQSNLKILSELKDKQKLLKQETLKLQTEINSFRKTMQNKFNDCLFHNKEQYTKNINGFKNNVLDDNQDLVILNEATLTAPLKPMQIDLKFSLNTDQTNLVTNIIKELNEEENAIEADQNK